MSSEVKKYAFIDALRGYAIVLVVLVHSAQAIRPESYTLQTLMDFGARGVQLFFIASSVTLCMSWYARSNAEQSPVRNFFIRRAFRIVPMFWIALAFYFLLYGLEPRYWAPYGLTWHSIPLTALFLNGYSPEIINALVPGGWSIAVEVNFYLLLPALLAVAHSLPRSITLTILAIAVSAVANRLFGVIFSNTGPDNRYVIDNFLFWNFFNQFPVFATGITAYFILSNPKLSRSAAAISAVILGGSIVVLGAFRGEAISYLTNHLMLTVVLFAMTTITLYQFPIKPLVNRPLQFLGKVSFSLYLVHFAILFYLDKYGVKSMFHPGDLSSLMYSAIVLMCASLVAFAFYSCVEKPCVRLGTMVIRHLESHNTSKGIKEAIARSGR